MDQRQAEWHGLRPGEVLTHRRSGVRYRIEYEGLWARRRRKPTWGFAVLVLPGQGLDLERDANARMLAIDPRRWSWRR